jgi:hypothetical protein
MAGNRLPIASALPGCALAMGCAHAPPPLHAAKLDIEGFFERNHRAVSATVNGVPARMLIDTGACRAPG